MCEYFVFILSKQNQNSPHKDKAKETQELTGRNEQGVSLFDGALVAHIDLVAKEHLVLIG